jgi:uncharacterized protein (TIGR00251 family)
MGRGSTSSKPIPMPFFVPQFEREPIMISVEETPSGLVVAVKAQPGARRNGVTGIHDGKLKVAVTQAPEKGKANSEIAKVLADALGLNKSQVELLSGQTSPQKKFLIRGMLARDFLAKVTTILCDLDAKSS